MARLWQLVKESYTDATLDLIKGMQLCLILSWSSWAVITKYHRLRGLKNRHLFLTLLRLRKPRRGTSRFGSW